MKTSEKPFIEQTFHWKHSVNTLIQFTEFNPTYFGANGASVPKTIVPQLLETRRQI